MKIPIKRYVMDESISWEERYQQLETHHTEETAWLITEVRRLEGIKYTVVVQLPPKDAQQPYGATMAYVLPATFSEQTLDDFRAAAEKGGCRICMFVVDAAGIEHVKWELEHYSSTRLD